MSGCRLGSCLRVLTSSPTQSSASKTSRGMPKRKSTACDDPHRCCHDTLLCPYPLVATRSWMCVHQRSCLQLARPARASSHNCCLVRSWPSLTQRQRRQCLPHPASRQLPSPPPVVMIHASVSSFFVLECDTGRGHCSLHVLCVQHVLEYPFNCTAPVLPRVLSESVPQWADCLDCAWTWTCEFVSPKPTGGVSMHTAQTADTSTNCCRSSRIRCSQACHLLLHAGLLCHGCCHWSDGHVAFRASPLYPG